MRAVGKVNEHGQGLDEMAAVHVMHSLGNLYFDQGRLDEAEAMYERALQGFYRALGPSHPKYQMVLQGLQSLKQLQGMSPLHPHGIGKRYIVNSYQKPRRNRWVVITQGAIDATPKHCFQTSPSSEDKAKNC